MTSRKQRLAKRKMSTDEIEFLLGTDLFDACPEEARSILLSSMAARDVSAGERFIRQGDSARNFYLIQNGSCLVSVEKDSATFPVSRLKSGDLVGEMAILTGENRNAHVDAETDMLMWGISRHEFEQLCLEHPPLRDFLTDIVTTRFAKSKFTPKRTIGKYVIKEILGQGGWSIVYRGVHSSLNMPVAVKMLKHNMAMDPDFMEKFRREAGVVARLNHENIVRVYDVELLYKTAFIVMEYLEGVPLDYLVENMPTLPLSRALDILIQVANGLKYAHGKGIVHQDIKPANIFIQEDDRARIVDFGLALPIGSIDDTGFGGTPFYMAPEQIECEEIDERTDVYSFGIMAYEIATGSRPFPQKDVSAVFRAHRETPVPDPRFRKPDLPEKFHDLVQKCTQKEPADRYQDFDGVLKDLLELVAGRGLTERIPERRARKVMSILMTFPSEKQIELAKLVGGFAEELKSLGAKVHVGDFQDI
jgi:tRNA A-37 threonylcarbamoyl transferase component Bud32